MFCAVSSRQGRSLPCCSTPRTQPCLSRPVCGHFEMHLAGLPDDGSVSLEMELSAMENSEFAGWSGVGEQPARPLVGGAGSGCGGLCCTREAPRVVFQDEPMHSWAVWTVLDLRAATESLCPGAGGRGEPGPPTPAGLSLAFVWRLEGWP